MGYRTFSVFFLACWCSGVAAAPVSVLPDHPFGDQRYSLDERFSLDLLTGLEPVGGPGAEDVWLVFAPRLSYAASGFLLSLGNPLRASLAERKPVPGMFDHWQDWLAPIREVAYDSAAFHVGLGVLRDVTLGSGTLVRNYSSALLREETRVGFRLWTDPRRLVEVQAFSASPTEPGPLGTMVSVKPFLKTASTPTPLQKMSFRGSSVAHLDAPARYHQSSTGMSILAEDGWGYELAERRDLFFYGGGLTLPLFEDALYHVHFLADLNAVGTDGTGFHYGAEGSATGPGNPIDQRWKARLELRWLRGEYLPAYLDRWYDLTSREISGQGEARTKVQVLDDLPGAARRGYLLELGYEVREYLGLELEYEHQDTVHGQGWLGTLWARPRSRLRLELTVGAPPLVRPGRDGTLVLGAGRYDFSDCWFAQGGMSSRFAFRHFDGEGRYSHLLGALLAVGAKL